MDFDNLFSISTEDLDSGLFEHINMKDGSISTEAEEDAIPEPPDAPDFDSSDSGGDDSGDSSGSGGDSGNDSSSSNYGSSDGGSEKPVEINTSPNPLANINRRQQLYESFIELQDSISSTIEILSSQTKPRTVEIDRLKEILDVVSKNMKCVFVQPINESLTLFGTMTRHYRDIVKLIEQDRHVQD